MGEQKDVKEDTKETDMEAVTETVPATEEKKKDKKRRRRRRRPMSKVKSVIYVGHVPRGFVEAGLNKFFSQFGTVEKVKLIRSKKTGNPKGYAFIEFDSDEVAEIAASTMNGYLMCGRVLKCNVVDGPSPFLFQGHKRPFKRLPRRAMAISRFNRPKTPEQVNGQTTRLLKRTRRKQAELEKLGINYKCPEVHIEKPKRTVFT